MHCQIKFEPEGRIFTTEDTKHSEESVGDGALQEFPKGIAERNDFSEVVGGEIGAGYFRIGAFATDLYYADHAIAGENRGANDFLDGFGAFSRRKNSR